jgi:hypothetical protein
MRKVNAKGFGDSMILPGTQLRRRSGGKKPASGQLLQEFRTDDEQSLTVPPRHHPIVDRWHGPSVMKQKPHSRRKRTTTKSVRRLPDLEHAKAAVLNRLTSLDAQQGYRHAIDEFADWHLFGTARGSTES